jgi:hypothetical protein
MRNKTGKNINCETCGNIFYRCASRIDPIKKHYCSLKCSSIARRKKRGKSKFLYPNHYLMKVNRRILFEYADNKCELCGQPARVIHHKDGSKDNHLSDNLQVLCFKCHGQKHKGRKNTSKYTKILGKTIKQIAQENNIPYDKAYSYFKQR